MNDQVLKSVLAFVILVLFSSAYYSLFKGSARILTLFQTAEEPLTEAERVRLDKLLESGKRYHNLSFVTASILIAISGLETFQEFAAPFGDLTFPKIQTSIGLYLLVIALLVISDRFFLMAYPWMRLDNRRPPYPWIAMGLSFERSLFSGFIFYLPATISAIASTIILGDVPEASGIITFSALSFAGLGLVYLPRTIYYWMHLVDQRIDHRGGSATLSMYLLYWYRLIRQIIYSLFIISPVVLIIPRWRDSQFGTFLVLAAITFAVLYVIRMIGGTKAVYRRVDRLGRRLGFPVVSKHYQ